MKSRILLALPILLLLLSFGLVEAEELFVNVTDAVVIAPSAKSQEMRLLIKFSTPVAVAERKSVDFACITFDADCTGDGDAISFEAFAVTTAWNSATVSWTGPWTRDGGDWDTDASADWITAEGRAKTVYLDVTDFVNSWLAEPSTNHGVIVRVCEPFTGAFTWNEVSPRLRILY